MTRAPSRAAGLALAIAGGRLAWADHGPGPATVAGGLGLGWLLVAGGLLALVLAVWALLAPEREESPPRRAAEEGTRR